MCLDQLQIKCEVIGLIFLALLNDVLDYEREGAEESEQHRTGHD